MKWNKITIQTITEAEDIIISAMYDIGLEGAQIEDKVPLSQSDKEEMFIDILPKMPKDDGIAYLNFFVKDDGTQDSKQLLAKIEEVLKEVSAYTNIGEGLVCLSSTEDKEWIDNWKEFFHQFTIDDLLVVPSWESVKQEDKDKKILHIDPGTAFGTGMHETTQLCVRQMKRYLTKETVLLDVGCGSGILGIIALLYGAAQAKGTDLDPCAIQAAKENKEANGIRPEQYEVKLGNLITDRTLQEAVGYACYDIVVCNILAEVLLLMTPVIVRHMKKGGIYIASGIIEEKETIVAEAVKAAGLAIREITHQSEWVCITAEKRN